MASTGRLDRKAKTALMGLLLVIVVLVALTIRSSVIALTPESLVTASDPQSQDELLQIGGHTVLLRHGSAGNRIAHWFHAGKKDSRAFEVGGSSFSQNSDVLTSEGQQHIEAFARILNNVQDLNARILSTSKSNPELADRRAKRVQATLLANGVEPTRVKVSDESITGGKELSVEPEVVVVVSD